MAADITILSGDVSVWYLDNNRTKMMDWSGAAGDTITMNELYSAMATLLDEPTTIENAAAFNADTPVEYTTGKIDAGDNDPWYITLNLMEHVTGGSLRTSGWARVETSNTGIIMVEVLAASNAIVAADIGLDISHTDTDAGTLLEVISDGGTSDFLFIRPDSFASTDSFDNTTGTLTCNAHTATSITTAGITGDMVWANIYSIGTIDPNVHLYVYRGPWNNTTPTQPATDESLHVYSVNSTTADFWVNGHIDICVPISDWKTTAFPALDEGYLRVFARKGGDLYASFEVANSTTSGGRNPVPMQTALDLNQGHGTKKIATGAWSGSGFTDLEVVSQATSLARGIVDLGNSTSGSELVYWPIAKATRGGELTAMVTTQLITGATSTETATSSGAAADDGPADVGWFTNTTPDLKLGSTNVLAAGNLDIDNDGNAEDYAVLIDCNANPLSEVYQWLKFICEQGQGDADMIEQAFSDDMGNGGQVDVWGEEFEGGMGYFIYTTEQGTNYEGDSVTVSGGGASGVIMYHDPAENIVFLRNIRGTFVASGNIDNDVTGASNSFDTITEVGQFAASVASPFGTYAGGTFFGARGVLIEDYLPADENKFILTDIQGSTRERPTSILITVTNLWGNAITNGDADLVGVYSLQGSGLDIDKDPADGAAVYAMNCVGGEAIGDTTLAVDDIPVWAPATGRVILVDDTDARKEYVLRYSSYVASTDIYTLANLDIASLDSANGTFDELTESGVFGSTKRGDLVYNHDLDEVAYVTIVNSANTITISPAFSADPTADHIELNCIPVITTSSDDAYNCIIHEYPLTDEQQASIIYPGSTFYFRVKVRNTRETDLLNGPIKPYSSDGSTGGTNQSIPTVRTIDTVFA